MRVHFIIFCAKIPFLIYVKNSPISRAYEIYVVQKIHLKSYVANLRKKIRKKLLQINFHVGNSYADKKSNP